MNHRAYSLFEVKSVNEDQRIITGLATSPTPDRVGDVVEPLGVKFKNPLPLLWQHRSDQPVGTVKFDKPTKNGITFTATMPKIAEPGPLKDRVDTAWGEVKAGLVRGVSIGFRELEYARIENGGLRFLESEVLELSLVTIPANAEASIQTIKSIDSAQQPVSGRKSAPVVRLSPPDVSGFSKQPPKHEATDMKTLAEQITALEAKRAANTARMEEVMQKSVAENRSTEEAEQDEFDTLEAEVDTIDKDLKRLRTLERVKAQSAKPVIPSPSIVPDTGDGSSRGPRIEVKMQPKLEPGIGYARLVKVKMAARLEGESPLVMAKKMYGPDSDVVGIITKANEVVAGTTLSGNWAYDLVSQEGAAVAAFLDYLRPQTILGRFGTGGIPGLTRLDFYRPYVTQTGGGAAYWVGEGKPKPLTAFDFDRSTLTPLKIANIAVLTEENIRYSSPNSDVIVRDALVQAIAAGLDVAFIDPANNGTANVKPAAVTYNAETVASTGDDADDVRLDVRALFAKFIAANNAPSSGVWVMSATNALALSMMVNTLGQAEFPGLSMTGGTFQGLPVIVSEHIGNVVALINARDIFLGDEGGVAVDMSREASIEMRSTGLGMDATAGTATAASVSMFQTNSVALRAERTISWKRARDSAVAYLTSVDWGGAVPTA
jgi:HK97 family phage prohead protease